MLYTAPGEDGCVNWTGGISQDGYGKITVPLDGRYAQNGTRTVSAHRFAYELAYGAVPAGLVIDHLCRNRRSVNPGHLEAVTNRENILRGEGPAAWNSTKTKCKSGHDLAGDNLYVSREGYRYCKECRRRWGRAWMQRKREKAA
jgi:hypothetical protein